MPFTYVIADLHGRYDLLSLAYRELWRRGKPGTIVHLGDYIDRGPMSMHVVTYLMDPLTIPVGCTRVVLKGNHEDIMVETIRKGLAPDWWIGNGGGATLQSYGHPEVSVAYGTSTIFVTPYYDPAVIPEVHLAFLEGLPMVHEDKHRVYVHAGVLPDVPLDQQKSDVLMWLSYKDNDHGGYAGRHVVHGHHQKDDGPHRWKGRTNLDVGAWYTGRLVIGVFDDDVAGGPVEIIEVLADD
jgi:serine/threonine protein phosphatase 1